MQSLVSACTVREDFKKVLYGPVSWLARRLEAMRCSPCAEQHARSAAEETDIATEDEKRSTKMKAESTEGAEGSKASKGDGVQTADSPVCLFFSAAG